MSSFLDWEHLLWLPLGYLGLRALVYRHGPRRRDHRTESAFRAADARFAGMTWLALLVGSMLLAMFGEAPARGFLPRLSWFTVGSFVAFLHLRWRAAREQG